MPSDQSNIVWVGIEVPAPNYPSKATPNEIEVFATADVARAWQSELRVTATSPTRELHKRAVRR